MTTGISEKGPLEALVGVGAGSLTSYDTEL